MKVTLNTSIASLGAQRQLGRLDSEIGSVFERLSTGLRINRAADDPAGLSIAEILKINNTVLNQGVKNLNDGISLLNIADTAVQQLTTITSRIMELAEQSANGTLGYKQRQAIDNEGQELSKEFTRIIQTTEFNGLNPFGNDFGTLTLQAGFGSLGQITGTVGGDVGTGGFGAATTQMTGTFVPWVTTGDMNGDGNLDLLAVDGVANTLSVLLGDGGGGFGAATNYATGVSTNSVVTGDFNGDGILDVVYSNAGSNTASLRLGDGAGGLGAASTFAAGTDPRGMTTGDFNGDGNLDFAAANEGVDAVGIFLGDGSGAFATVATYAVGISPQFVRAADFDGDGVLDLATVNENDDTVSVLLGDGSGGFGAATAYGVGSNPTSISLGDINGDGAVDIVATNENDSTASILLGDGSGSFGPQSTFATGADPVRGALADFNGDGYLDFVSSNGGGGDISVFLGDGGGSFGAATDYAGLATSAFALGDFNSDSVLDLGLVAGGTLMTSLGEATDGLGPLLPFSLATQADALQAMAPLRNKLNLLNQQRGEIGAFQGRIEAGMRALEVTALENKAAEARIRDADVATETANLVRLQIAQQAAAAVLAQANTTGAIALQLIGG